MLLTLQPLASRSNFPKSETQHPPCQLKPCLLLGIIPSNRLNIEGENVVIDRLISKAAEFHIPSGCTKKIYKNTNDSDQLRRLWLAFYVYGEIPGARLQAELQDGRVHPQFLKDLAVAQMARIAKTNGI